ncbi:hypothetical protein [Aureivirga sp. CE67]|uniref:hypothetical protein n=1 Tax=Aureivirga sp. CE67 TaxID=1788983 RepID=UPI0018CB7DFB|nr:hypothetical protein [Aureivirga sp. CE67]
MKRLILLILIVIAGVAIYLSKISAKAPVYDLVLRDGDILLDGSKALQKVNIGINDDTIAAISKYKLYGRQIINAKNHTIIPGFIHIEEDKYDPSMHETYIENGITSVLYLEPEPKKISHYQQQPDLNFGFINPSLIKDANYADLSKRINNHKFCKNSDIIYTTEMENNNFLKNVKKLNNQKKLSWHDISMRCSKNIAELTKNNTPFMKKRGTLKIGNKADILVIPSCCQKTKNPVQLVFINGDLISKIHVAKNP